MPQDDLYAVLQVDRRASASEIRKAYLVLARQNHPDKGHETASFQALLHAYEVLSDPARRAAYDAELARGMRDDSQFDDFGFSGFGFGGFPQMPAFPAFPFGGGRRGHFGPSFPFEHGRNFFGSPSPFEQFSGFPFNDSSPFGPNFTFNNASPFGPGFGAPRSHTHARSPFAGFFNDPLFGPDPFDGFHAEEFEEETAPSRSDRNNEEVVQKDKKSHSVQKQNFEQQMKENYQGLKATNPSTSKEYVIKDGNGNPVGWGYTATWSSSPSSKYRA